MSIRSRSTNSSEPSLVIFIVNPQRLPKHFRHPLAFLFRCTVIKSERLDTLLDLYREFFGITVRWHNPNLHGPILSKRRTRAPSMLMYSPNMVTGRTQS